MSLPVFQIKSNKELRFNALDLTMQADEGSEEEKERDQGSSEGPAGTRRRPLKPQETNHQTTKEKGRVISLQASGQSLSDIAQEFTPSQAIGLASGLIPEESVLLQIAMPNHETPVIATPLIPQTGAIPEHDPAQLIPLDLVLTTEEVGWLQSALPSYAAPASATPFLHEIAASREYDQPQMISFEEAGSMSASAAAFEPSTVVIPFFPETAMLHPISEIAPFLQDATSSLSESNPLVTTAAEIVSPANTPHFETRENKIKNIPFLLGQEGATDTRSFKEAITTERPDTIEKIELTSSWPIIQIAEQTPQSAKLAKTLTDRPINAKPLPMAETITRSRNIPFTGAKTETLTPQNSVMKQELGPPAAADKPEAIITERLAGTLDLGTPGPGPEQQKDFAVSSPTSNTSLKTTTDHQPSSPNNTDPAPVSTTNNNTPSDTPLVITFEETVDQNNSSTVEAQIIAIPVAIPPVDEQPHNPVLAQLFSENHGDTCACAFCNPPAKVQTDIEQKFSENHGDACDCEFCKAKKAQLLLPAETSIEAYEF